MGYLRHVRQTVAAPVIPASRGDARVRRFAVVLLVGLGLTSSSSGSAPAHYQGPASLTSDAAADCQAKLLRPGLVETRLEYVGRQVVEVGVAIRSSPTSEKSTAGNGYTYAFACVDLVRFRVGVDIVDRSSASGPVVPVTGTKYPILEGVALPTKRRDRLRYTRALVLPNSLTLQAVKSRRLSVRITISASAKGGPAPRLVPDAEALALPDRTIEVFKPITDRAVSGQRARRGGRRLGTVSENALNRLIRRCPVLRNGRELAGATINLGTPTPAVDDGSKHITARAEWYGPTKKNDPHPEGVDYVYRLHRGARLCAALAYTDEYDSPRVLSRLTPTLSTRSWGYLRDPNGRFGQVIFLLKP